MAQPDPSASERTRPLASRRREWTPVLLTALLLLLLAVLAAMQHHWLGRASEADLQRTSASLQAASSRFAADFNRELADLLIEVIPVLFRGPEEAEVLAAVGRWRERAAWPDLAQDVWQIQISDPGPVVRLVTSGETTGTVPAPEEVEQLAIRLAERVAVEATRSDTDPVLEPPRVLAAEIPAIVFARPRGLRHGHRGVRNPDDPHPRRRRWRPWLVPAEGEGPIVWVFRLDSGVILGKILPELAQRHFSAEPELGLRVLGSDRQIVWSSNAPGDRGAAVARSELFGPLRPRGERGLGHFRKRDRHPPLQDVLAVASGIDRGQWMLEVLHPAGSLDRAVASARHRNLVLGLVILLVLAGSIVLLAQGAWRAQALARRQMEFVAGVTHELRTPVAALRSAGQNLADGVVGPERVKTYGELVDREGRRLEEAVEQILAFAGRSPGVSGGTNLQIETLDPIQAARRAVGELSPILEEWAVEVEVSHANSLPKVRADAESLGRALRNLIQNAALHGRPEAPAEAWVGVQIGAADGEVLFRVRDRGPGIDPADRKRIFEPFVRGLGLAASNVPGSGLGLSLVRQVAEALGGSVRLDQDDEHTTFTLALPAAHPAAADRADPR
ncbi:MAG: HAMP domain-containing histidine kinase [Thermoanaerobaculia bacterium]|nr:HAMP domain-containing histidine kinase [Thermoanaerobaculia bacterium]